MLGKVEISGESIFLWPSHSAKRIYSILFRSRISSLTRVKYLSLTCANLNESDSRYNKGYIPRERVRRWSSAQWSKRWPFFTDINVPLIFTFFDKVQLDLRKFFEKVRLLLFKTKCSNLCQRYFKFRSTHSVQVSHHSCFVGRTLICWPYWFFDEKKNEKKPKPCCRQSSLPASILHLHIRNLPCDKGQRLVSRLWSEWSSYSR